MANETVDVRLVGDLRSKHTKYSEWLGDWQFLRAAYNGAKALLDWGVLVKHERESQANFQRRIDNGYGFGYSKSLVDLFVHYIHKEPVVRDLGKLEKDELWGMFLKDCDYEGNSYDEFLKDIDRDASIEGSVGVLVDKPSNVPLTRQEELSHRIYPYLSIYRAESILDFTYLRDEYDRPYLSYLKLYDHDNRYRIWTTTAWEIWEEPEDVNGLVIDTESEAILVDRGPNTLGEIPFIFIYNEDMVERGKGVSDITDVSIIDASIIRNCSQMEEVVDYAAFPMMRKPKPERGEITDDVVGVTAVLEFDPDKPEAKPDWLEAKISEPVEAILAIIEKKIVEIYRASNTGGMSSSSNIERDTQSGVALRVKFQLLNSLLVNRGNRLSRLELEIIRLFRKYQNIDQEEITVRRSDSYDLESLSEDLENALTAKQLVNSETFMRRLQRRIVRQMLPAEETSILNEIDKEIESYVPNNQDLRGYGDGFDKKQFNASQKPASRRKIDSQTPGTDDTGEVSQKSNQGGS